MKAFWWFKENSIAGMARPGFNGIHWFELPFEEALAFGWLGQRSSSSLAVSEFHNHVRDYGGKLNQFVKLENEAFLKLREKFTDEKEILELFNRLNEKTNCYEIFEIADGKISFRLSHKRIQEEIDYLAKQGIRRIVALTEEHHQKDILQRHFDLHHFAIEDLKAPQLDQVHQLATIIESSERKKEKLAVHCMAGIGRTSTMLMGAHIVLGHNHDEMVALIKKQNPSFVLTGPQSEFLQTLC